MIIHKSYVLQSKIILDKSTKHDLIVYYDDIMFGWELFSEKLKQRYTKNELLTILNSLRVLENTEEISVLFVSTYKKNIRYITMNKVLNASWIIKKLLDTVADNTHDMKTYTIEEALRKLKSK